MKTIDNYNLQVRTLMRIFREFKLNPKKIFVVKDFFKSNPKLYAQRYLTTLIKLGIIEKFNIKFYSGRKRAATGDAVGYRLKRKWKIIKEEKYCPLCKKKRKISKYSSGWICLKCYLKIARKEIPFNKLPPPIQEKYHLNYGIPFEKLSSKAKKCANLFGEERDKYFN